MLLQITGGIVLGGLCLYFLLKTRAGWYVLVGALPAALTFAAFGALAFTALTDGRQHSDAETLAYLIFLAVATFAMWFMAPRTVVHYRAAISEFPASERNANTFWLALKDAWDETLVGVVVLFFFACLLLAPIGWAQLEGSPGMWCMYATVVSWGTVAALGSIGLYTRMKARTKPRTSSDVA